MSKKENKQPEGDDYLEQLQWQSSFRRRWSTRFAPKWKYRIVYNNKKASIGDRILIWVMALLFFGGLALVSITSLSEGDYGFPIAIGAIVLLIGAVMFFALKDSKKVDDNNDEDFE